MSAEGEEIGFQNQENANHGQTDLTETIASELLNEMIPDADQQGEVHQETRVEHEEVVNTVDLNQKMEEKETNTNVVNDEDEIETNKSVEDEQPIQNSEDKITEPLAIDDNHITNEQIEENDDKNMQYEAHLQPQIEQTQDLFDDDNQINSNEEPNESNGLEPGLIVNDDDLDTSEQNQAVISEPPGTPVRRTRRNLASSKDKSRIYKISQGYQEDPNYPDDMLAGILKSFIKSGKNPEIIYQAPLIKYTNHQIELSAQAQNYDEARTYEAALGSLLNLTDSNEQAAKQEAQRKHIEDRLQSAKDSQNEASTRWNERIDIQKKKNEEALKNLVQSHKSDEQEFEAKWANPDFLAPFSKPSPTLLRLKQIEENLALTKNFERAKDMKKQIESIQKEEAAESRRRAIEAMRKEFKTMEMHHKRDLECHQQYCESVIQRLELEKVREIRGYELIIKRHEEATTPRQPIAIKEPVVYTSRPIKRPNNSTTNRILPTLNIGGINVKQYLRTKKSTTARMSTGSGPREASV